MYTATRPNAPMAAALFTAPGVDPRTRVPHLAEPLTLPAELTQNHVYVQGRINGQGPIALLVDAGVAIDDELVAIDGAPVAGLTLEAIRTRLKQPGQRVRLELRRGDTARTAELALRRLI